MGFLVIMNNRKTRNGFTIIEVVIALVVLSLLVLTIQVALPMLRTNKDETLSWYYTLSELEENQKHFKISKMYTNQIYLKDDQDQTQYVLKQNRQSLILSTNDGGYIPLMDDIRLVQFCSGKGKTVEMKVHTKDDQVFRARLNMEESVS